MFSRKPEPVPDPLREDVNYLDVPYGKRIKGVQVFETNGREAVIVELEDIPIVRTKLLDAAPAR